MVFARPNERLPDSLQAVHHMDLRSPILTEFLTVANTGESITNPVQLRLAQVAVIIREVFNQAGCGTHSCYSNPRRYRCQRCSVINLGPGGVTDAAGSL
jgi:hypothetical protein